MKLYVVEKGSPVVLTNNNGDRKHIISKAASSFNDTVTDPVREYNKNKKHIDYYKFYVDPTLLSKENSKYTHIEVNETYVNVIC